MKRALLTLLAVPALAFGDHHEGKSIFNGKDLTGWKVPKDNIWWTVADGAIVEVFMTRDYVARVHGRPGA